MVDEIDKNTGKEPKATKKGVWVKKIGESLENIIATAITALVVLYILTTVWWGQKLDLQIPHIPAETYALILLALWAASQRAQANTFNLGGAYAGFWKWKDRLESWAMLFFLIGSLYVSVKTGRASYAPVVVGFLVYAVYDWIDSMKRQVLPDVSPQGALANISKDVRVEQNVEVITVVKRLVRMPDGSLVPWDPGDLLLEHQSN